MIGIIVTIIIAAILAVLWIKGITYMNNNHKDYKGEDF